ncbi:MAG: DNA repair protein RecN [Bacteroidetes bacterium]|nr:MAG: DNA repair protein RecN [Bacteroidota bacterium]
MLRSLYIENFALIDRLEIQLDGGYTVFTGETGSGKSILLGALNLILGERADLGSVRNPGRKTIIEGNFELGTEYKSFFEEHDLDFETQTCIRREISHQGKSRAFINDTPVQLQVLKLLTEQLIHIHSQHHTLQLKSEQFQLDVLDELGQTMPLRSTFQQQFLEVNRLKRQLDEKRGLLSGIDQEADYISFQLKELEEMSLGELDYASMEEELNGLERFDQLKEAFQLVSFTLGGENQLLDRLGNLQSQLHRTSSLHPKLQELSERIDSVLLELRDCEEDAAGTFESLEMSPERKLELEERLSRFNHVLSKHRLSTQEELKELEESYRSKEGNSAELQGEVQRLERLYEEGLTQLSSLGEELTQKREESKISVERSIEEALKELKMEHTNILFEMEKKESPGVFGYDKITWKFSPNKGVPLKAIEKTASGGELSRLMLVVQLLLSEHRKLPGIVFDEIDTGVSGEVAEKIGRLFSKMGERQQLIAITHLPQVAAKATQHFKVLKQMNGQETSTEVVAQNQEERVVELARLMSGEEVSESALKHARELMRSKKD